MNFADVLDVSAARAPDGEAICLDGARITYRQLLERARRVAGLLVGQNISRSAKAAVLLYNAREYAEIAFGIVGASAVLLPVNPRLASAEMLYVLQNADVEVVFVGVDFLEIFAEIRGELPQVRSIFVVGTESTELTSSVEFEWYEAAIQGAHPLNAWRDVDDNHDCMIVYTSGTSGIPKGAVRSHGSALWGASNFTSALGAVDVTVDRFLYAIPLASVGFLNVFASCVMNGLPVEIMYKFDAAEALRMIEEVRISHAYFVPSMWRMMLRSPAIGTSDISALRVAIWGGEPLPDHLRSEIRSQFGDVLIGVFGTTEGALVSSRPGDDRSYPKTAGRAAGYNIFRVVDDDGIDLPRGEVGELINKGPATFTRYYKDEDATAATLRDGWYFTGDLATMNRDGYIFIVDRKKEMLISGGQNVYPAEIERVLCDHPTVSAAAVIGVPHDVWGEVPMAFVVLAAGAEPEVTGLEAHASGNLAKYK
ncbi:MAG: long-chain fatty acid--CoA ligase, partial [Gammaproteobacteria bacterium]|nr:long-chain fatty acid--CoA ligase [Gammaproteobacteria bacterium]